MSTVIILYSFLVATLAVHLLEEIKTGFRLKFPFGEIPRPVFIGINICIYTYSIFTLGLAVFWFDISVPFIYFFTIVQILNVVGHIGFMIRAKG